MVSNMLFGGDLPPEEKAFRERVQQGLPAPQTDAAALVIVKRDALEGILSGSITAIQFMTSAVIACNELPPGTTRGSVARCVFNSASLGLMFGNVRGEAYLIPYLDKKETKRTGVDVYECNLIIGYKGFRKLAFDSGFLKAFTTDVVLEGELFEVWTDEKGRHFKHEPKPNRDVKPDGGNVVASYCQYSTRTGSDSMVVMYRSQIDRVRPGYASDFWARNFPQMARKSAVREAAKEWALTGTLEGAVVIDEQAESGVLQSLLFDAGLLEETKMRVTNRRQKTGLSERQEELRNIVNERKGGES